MRRAALAVAAALACSSSSTPSGPPTVGSNAGLSAEVDVYYDGLGIPHIYAASDADAAYVHGYVQARDRLFEMDFLRRYARGKLAEIAGPPALPLDEYQRVVFTAHAPSSTGSWRIEDVIAEQVRPDLRTVLGAYAAGVNRYLQDLRNGANGARLPAEYEVVGLPASSVASWSIQDTLAIGRLLTWQLSETLGDELNYALVGASGMPAATFADLTRFPQAVPSYIVPAAQGTLPLSPPLHPGPAGTGLSVAGAAAFRASLPRLFGPEKAASNNWVVGPQITASGKPLVANDPHLQLWSPSIWHLAHLATPTRDVAGVAFPGAPVIPIGTNGHIAFGDTVVGYDVTDLYAEQVSGGMVQTASGPVPLTLVHESIAVRGQPPVDYVVQIVPGHGPLLPGATVGPTSLSFRWTGHEPSQELAAFYDVDAAASVAQAFAAMAQFEVGAQNFVVADDQGHIGYDPHAYVPVRGSGGSCTTPPWTPLPGWDGSCEWTGRIPDAPSCGPTLTPGALPCLEDPPAGFVATANNDITGVTGTGNPLSSPPYLYATTDIGFRHARIVERLRAPPATGFTIDDMTSIQLDDISLLARALQPALAAWFGWNGSSCAAVSAELQPACAALLSWDFTTPSGLSGETPLGAFAADPSGSSAAAALFHAFVPRLARRILDDDLSRYTTPGSGSPLSVDALVGLVGDQFVAKYLVALAQTAAGAPPAVPLQTGEALCDDVNTPPVETCADMAVLALGDAVGFLAQAAVFGTSDPAGWRWGRIHRVIFSSPLAELGIPIFDLGPYANQGGLYTVDVANFGWADDGSSGFDERTGFVQHDGPSVRFSAELLPALHWRAVIPGGESGFPGDPHDGDQIPAWLSGQPGDQLYAKAQVAAQASSELVFKP